MALYALIPIASFAAPRLELRSDDFSLLEIRDRFIRSAVGLHPSLAGLRRA